MNTTVKKKTTSFKSTSLRIRVDNDLKQASERIFQQLGLTTTEAIRLFLTQVRLRHGLPFRVELEKPFDSHEEDVLLPTAMRQAALDSVYED